jgi:hypothetical protein
MYASSSRLDVKVDSADGLLTIGELASRSGRRPSAIRT